MVFYGIKRCLKTKYTLRKGKKMKKNTTSRQKNTVNTKFGIGIFGFGVVKDFIDDNGYGFVTLVNGKTCFIHFRGCYAVEKATKGSAFSHYLTDMPDNRFPKAGDRVFLRMVKDEDPNHSSDFTSRAWGYDPFVYPWNYEKKAVDVLEKCLSDEYSNVLKGNKHAQDSLILFMRQYLEDRFKELISKQNDPRLKRPWTMIATLQKVEDILQSLEIAFDFDDLWHQLQRVVIPKCRRQKDPVERLVRKVVEALEKGQPFSARKEYEKVIKSERMSLASAKARSRGNEISLFFRSGPSLEEEKAPVTTAFEHEPVLGWLKDHVDCECLNAQIQLIHKIEMYMFSGTLHQLRAEWDETHNQDPEFTMLTSCYSSAIELLITELFEVGKWEVIEAITDCLEKDPKYDELYEDIIEELPDEMEDHFAALAKLMQDSEVLPDYALYMYKKYITDQDKEKSFRKRNPNTSIMLNELEVRFRATLLGSEADFLSIQNPDLNRAEDLIKRYDQSDREIQEHPSWAEACLSLIQLLIEWELFDKAYECLHKYSHVVYLSDDSWKKAAFKIYQESLVLIINGSKAWDPESIVSLAELINKAPRFMWVQKDWPLIVQKAINALAEYGKHDLAVALLEQRLPKSPKLLENTDEAMLRLTVLESVTLPGVVSQ